MKLKGSFINGINKLAKQECIMPRIQFQTVSSSSPETAIVANGMTLGEFLMENGVSANKVQILVNGVSTGDMDYSLNGGDSIVLKPRNFASGQAA